MSQTRIRTGDYVRIVGAYGVNRARVYGTVLDVVDTDTLVVEISGWGTFRYSTTSVVPFN